MNSTNPEFDYQNQSVTILVADGTSVNITLGYVDQIQSENIQYAIIFAVQLGACGLLVLLLAMLTKPDKRRAPLFFMNILSLILIIARSVLQLQFLLGPWSTAYRFYTYDFSDIPRSAYITSVATIALQLLLNICIQISLILQVRVVYSSTPKLNLYMTLISAAIALTFLGVYMKMVQENIDSVLNAANYTQTTWTISKILFAFNVCFFTSIFNFKLWIAIRRRKALGLPSFGPLQIIFIMGCQTMIVPGKFSSPAKFLPNWIYSNPFLSNLLHPRECRPIRRHVLLHRYVCRHLPPAILYVGISANRYTYSYVYIYMQTIQLPFFPLKDIYVNGHFFHNDGM